MKTITRFTLQNGTWSVRTFEPKISLILSIEQHSERFVGRLFSISHVFFSYSANVVFPKKVGYSRTTKAYSKGLHAGHELASLDKKL